MLTALAPADGETILPLADAKVHLNLTDDDTFHESAIESARDAAIGWLEGYAEQSLQERDFLWTSDQFTSRMRLPIGPVASDGIASVEYYDSEAVDTTVDAADYVVGGGTLAAATGASWPYANGQPGGVRVTFAAGYTTADDIPFNLMAALKLALTAFFEDRTNPDLSGAMRVADQVRPIL